MVRKLGILIQDASPSQLAYELIRAANEASLKNTASVYLFYRRAGAAMSACYFATMPLHEARYFDGPMAATDLFTAEFLTRCPRASRRAFWSYDLEWLRLGVFPYRAVADVYRHPLLDLRARSQSHADALTNNWGKPARVTPCASDLLGSLTTTCSPSTSSGGVASTT